MTATSKIPGQKITILEWRRHERNTLKGFLAIRLQSGLILHGLMLHMRGDVRWIGYPAREYVDATGAKQFARIIEFVDRPTADKFSEQVLAALDAHLAGL